MSYPPTATHQENTFPGAMYNQPQARKHHDAQASTGGDGLPLNTMLNQFAGLSLPGGMAASTSGANSQLYVTADGQFFCAPAPGYAPQSLAPTQLADTAYAYPSTLPYLAQAAYHNYVPGYPMMPYTPSRAGYYGDRADHLHKDVPGLDNRRGSYSTNESTPGTPYYGSTLREQGTQIAAVDRSPFGSTPSPQNLSLPHLSHNTKHVPYKTIPVDVDIDALLVQHPAIPRAVPAVFTPRESMRTLDQSLSNPIFGNRNVYIRGLHPNTDDETLAAYAARFGKVETSKAIIDTSTGACKGFGFAKYFHIRDSELCIRGFYKLGYEVGFARESFNSRLKAEGDEQSTNLYVSNLPKNMTESELGAIFMDYTVSSSRILRDNQNNSRGVGFARFENRDVCEEIIKKFHGQPIGEEGLLLQVRYADTPAQKDLKRITTERRQFRTNEYNVGAYGGTAAEILALSPQLSVPSPIAPRASQIARHMPTSRASGSWKPPMVRLLSSRILTDKPVRFPSLNPSLASQRSKKSLPQPSLRMEPPMTVSLFNATLQLWLVVTSHLLPLRARFRAEGPGNHSLFHGQRSSFIIAFIAFIAFYGALLHTKLASSGIHTTERLLRTNTLRQTCVSPHQTYITV